MKERHKATAGVHARALLSAMNVSVGQDFHTLTGSQVDTLLEEADRVRYRKPKGANGSRGRYFFQRIQREAKY